MVNSRAQCGVLTVKRPGTSIRVPVVTLELVQFGQILICIPKLGYSQIFIFEAGEGVVRAHHIPIRQKGVFDLHWRSSGVSPLINGHPDAGTWEGHTPQK